CSSDLKLRSRWLREKQPLRVCQVFCLTSTAGRSGKNEKDGVAHRSIPANEPGKVDVRRGDVLLEDLPYLPVNLTNCQPDARRALKWNRTGAQIPEEE
ncbi:MAG: hypothetical protein ABTQ32_10925, partial [Myxococcaceae bacterium]